jgi:hypothetical protein
MKIKIVDESGQVYAERPLPTLAGSPLPDDYLDTIQHNARIVEGNKRLLLDLLGTLQDAQVINGQGINTEILDTKVAVATIIQLVENHSSGAKMGGLGKTALSIGKQVAGKAKPVPLDLEKMGDILKQFGEDNAVLIPGISEYFALITDQLKAKFAKNG